MSTNNLQQKRHSRQDIIYNSFDMYNAEAFANWLENSFRKSSFKSYAEVGEKVGLSRSAIAGFAKAKPQSATNKASRPRRENVIAIAKALEADVDEALLLAGYAPTTDPLPPELIAEGFEGLDNDDLREIAEFIKFKKAQKAGKGKE